MIQKEGNKQKRVYDIWQTIKGLLKNEFDKYCFYSWIVNALKNGSTTI